MQADNIISLVNTPDHVTLRSHYYQLEQESKLFVDRQKLSHTITNDERPALVPENLQPIYNVVQQPKDQSMRYLSAPVDNEAVVKEVTEANIDEFNPAARIRLPNGNWMPSCKHVSKG
jgi:hypothetical protein